LSGCVDEFFLLAARYCDNLILYGLIYVIDSSAMSIKNTYLLAYYSATANAAGGIDSFWTCGISTLETSYLNFIARQLYAQNSPNSPGRFNIGPPMRACNILL